ncbi:MAG: sirohydrochlorin cobaltochelatase [Clostridia bacterium]|nr:sirohydrochlorin cobaltochelatase [Clostridia bacterium]
MRKTLILLIISMLITSLLPAAGLAEGKRVLLVVSTGTKQAESRENAIGAIEQDLAAAYPEMEIRRAFMSELIISLIEEQDGVKFDNIVTAMRRMIADGVTDVVIQPTFVMNGSYQESLIEQVSPFEGLFDSFKIGDALLSSEDDYTLLSQAIAEISTPYLNDDTAVIWMGHGTEHASNDTYQIIQNKVNASGQARILVGTVEAEPSLDDVLAAAQAMNAKKVVLMPLMVTAGTHAYEDMAGDEEDSWKTAFESAGFQVECVLKGLGEYENIRAMFVQHAQSALQDSAPIQAAQLADGDYPIEVTCSSEHFRVTAATLTVKSGTMSALITLSGTAYIRFFVGTAEEADAAEEAAFIPNTTDAEGAYQFEIPVSCLDAEISYAAWSKNKETWYDRALVFVSASLPETAFLTK